MDEKTNRKNNDFVHQIRRKKSTCSTCTSWLLLCTTDRLLLHMLVFQMCVYLFLYLLLVVFVSADTMLKTTINGCPSWNRPLTRSLEASLAQSSLTCLKKLSTCWCIMTGKDTCDICSPRQTHGKLTYWWQWSQWEGRGWGQRIKQQN